MNGRRQGKEAGAQVRFQRSQAATYTSMRVYETYKEKARDRQDRDMNCLKKGSFPMLVISKNYKAFSFLDLRKSKTLGKKQTQEGLFCIVSAGRSQLLFLLVQWEALSVVLGFIATRKVP